MATQETFQLYTFFASSCCQRVIIAAHLKSIPLTFSYIDLERSQHHDDGYQRTLNPSKSVPTLVVTSTQGKKTIIRHSVSILEYIEERFPHPSPLLPPLGHAEARALVRDFVNIITVDVAPPTNSRIGERVQEIRGERDDRIAFVSACFTDGFRAYEALLAETHDKSNATGCFTVGEAVTMADVCLVPTVDQFLMQKLDLSFAPRVQRLYNSLKAMPAFQAADWRKQEDTPAKFRVD